MSKISYLIPKNDKINKAVNTIIIKFLPLNIPEPLVDIEEVSTMLGVIGL